MSSRDPALIAFDPNDDLGAKPRDKKQYTTIVTERSIAAPEQRHSLHSAHTSTRPPTAQLWTESQDHTVSALVSHLPWMNRPLANWN